MPSKSKTQQRLMGVAYAVKSGDMQLSDVDNNYKDKVKDLVDGMTLKQLKDFAETKHDDLPEEVEEGISPANISGMGSIQLPTDSEPGSGDVPAGRKSEEDEEDEEKQNEKMKNLIPTFENFIRPQDIDEARDFNDPVLMKMRAAQMKRNQKAAKNNDEATLSPAKAKKIQKLKDERAQIMRDMEQEAEMEGGEIADRYGDMLNKIDQQIIKLGGNPLGTANGEFKLTEAELSGMSGFGKLEYTIDDLNLSYGWAGALSDHFDNEDKAILLTQQAIKDLCNTHRGMTQMEALALLNSKAGRHMADLFIDGGAVDATSAAVKYLGNKAKVHKYAKDAAKVQFESVDEAEEVFEWGGSDQHAMNQTIHKDMGKPRKMPSPFDSKLRAAAEDAVDWYWDEWPEYKTDRAGLIDNAVRSYLRAMFKKDWDMMVRMFEPIDEAFDGNMSDFRYEFPNQFEEVTGNPIKAIKKMAKKGKGFEVRTSTYMSEPEMKEVGDAMGLALVSYEKSSNIAISIYESNINELRTASAGSTSAAFWHELEDRKYELKKPVKGVNIGNHSKVTLPKGTILHNLPGGLFAKHKDLAGYKGHINSDEFGVLIRKDRQVLQDIEKNSKVLESIDINEGRSINKIKKEYDKVITDMAAKVKSWKECKANGDTESEAKCLADLKDLTAKKKALMSELDDAVGLKDIDAQLAESLDEARSWGTFGTPEAKKVIKQMDKTWDKFSKTVSKAHADFRSQVKSIINSEDGGKSGITDSEGDAYITGMVEQFVKKEFMIDQFGDISRRGYMNDLYESNDNE